MDITRVCVRKVIVVGHERAGFSRVAEKNNSRNATGKEALNNLNTKNQTVGFPTQKGYVCEKRKGTTHKYSTMR